MAKKFSPDSFNNSLMKNFIPDIEVQSSNLESGDPEIAEIVDNKKQEVKIKKECVKEKRIPTTFYLNEDLDTRLSSYVFKARQKKGKRINKTQILTEAIQRFLDQEDTE